MRQSIPKFEEAGRRVYRAIKNSNSLVSLNEKLESIQRNMKITFSADMLAQIDRWVEKDNPSIKGQ